MLSRGNTFSRAAAVLFVVWGLVHLIVGATPIVALYTSGPTAMFAHAELTIQPTDMDATMDHVANLIAEYYFDIFALGVLAIIVAVALVRPNRPLGFWICFVVLGIADAAFLFLEIVPGYQPLLPPLLGPIVYLAGVALAALGLRAPSTVAPGDPDTRTS